MKFSEQQIAFMKEIGIDVDFDKLTDEDMVLIEDKVASELETKGFDEDYEPTETGRMCESILDILND